MIIYKFIKHLYTNIKYTKIINKVYKDEKLIEKLQALFHINFKKDWVGRIYCVLNPNTNMGDFDPNNSIYEYNERGLDNTTYVENFMIEKLSIIRNFIRANNLFDLLTYEVKKLDVYDNYLFIIEPITLPDCLKYTKKFLYLLVAIIAIILGIILII